MRKQRTEKWKTGKVVLRVAYQPSTGMDVLAALVRLAPWLAVGGWIGWNGLLGWAEASERKRKEGGRRCDPEYVGR